MSGYLAGMETNTHALERQVFDRSLIDFFDFPGTKRILSNLGGRKRLKK